MNSNNRTSKRARCAQMPGPDLYNPPCMPAASYPRFPTGLPLGPQTSPMPCSPQVMPPPTIYNPTTSPSAPEMNQKAPGTMPAPSPYLMPAPPFSGEAPARTVVDINYTAGFLRSIIGSIVVVDFLIGTNSMADRSGKLIQVGASYIVLEDVVSGAYTMCDLYSIKFVRIYRYAGQQIQPGMGQLRG